MPEHHVTVTTAVHPDAFGVVDGREVVANLIPHLLQMLSPYVGRCPHCAVEALRTITRRVIDSCEDTEQLMQPVTLVNEASAANPGAWFGNHLRYSWTRTAELVGRNHCPHESRSHFGWPF